MMTMKRIWVLFLARNREFFRDRAGFGWNILFPFLIVAGFGVIYNDNGREAFKAGLFPAQVPAVAGQTVKEGAFVSSPILSALPEALRDHPLLEWVVFESEDAAMDKLRHHKVDILVQTSGAGLRYWISDVSPRGQVAEKIVREAVPDPALFEAYVTRETVHGRHIRYLDWLFPGILGMNIMFSAFFGVSYVITRYRRNGVLKRLKATPVTAFEYLTSQLLSRIVVMAFSTAVVWLGCDLIFSFEVQGSPIAICIVFLAGICCMTCLGLVLACRGTNEELTNGIINFICWPMMFLSEVWFSIEGAAQWVRDVARVLPLTHFLSAARKVMNDGASLADVSPELMALMGLSLICLAVGSFFFSWTR